LHSFYIDLGQAYLAINSLLIMRQNCDTEGKEAFCLEIVTPVSSANVWVLFIYLFIGGLYIYVMKN